MASHEGAGGQVEDQTAIHLLVEVEVKVVEGSLRVAKLSLLGPALQQAVAATSEFVGDQQERKSMGGMASACAWWRRVSSTAAIPPSRSCRYAILLRKAMAPKSGRMSSLTTPEASTD
jgi:hypothetical protein